MEKIVLVVSMLILMVGNCLFANSSSADDLDVMIGQMIMVGFRGMEVDDSSKIIQQIKEYHLGGIILFDYDVQLGIAQRNIDNVQQVAKLTATLHAAAEIPLFIAIDQEGGRVARLKERHGFPLSVSAEFLGQQNDLEVTKMAGKEIAQTLQDVGINVNLAPVVDVNINPDNPAIGRIGRSFSANHDSVSLHAEAFINGMNLHNIKSCIKHFPGHGSAFNDSHYGLTDITETWTEAELIPYRYLIEKDMVEMIMTGHLYHQGFDSEHPATLSANTLIDKLRNELGFQGLIVSDDMNMQAITDYYGIEEAVLLAIEADVDILLYANNMQYDPDIAAMLHGYIRRLVTDGVITEERIRRSYERIMRVKEDE